MSIGQGALRMTFSHPALARRFKTARPRLSVDGVERPLDGWSPQVVAVPAGPHRLRVAVLPVAGTAAKGATPGAPAGAGATTAGAAEEGVAEADVTVGVGAQVQVAYRAPWSRGGRGTLRVVAAKAFGD
ncbi:MAG: hypothetical protein HOV79_06430 [Hamadaea sp.]|nr:hypothetical protein [Hamadaea sp.]